VCKNRNIKCQRLALFDNDTLVRALSVNCIPADSCELYLMNQKETRLQRAENCLITAWPQSMHIEIENRYVKLCLVVRQKPDSSERYIKIKVI